MTRKHAHQGEETCHFESFEAPVLPVVPHAQCRVDVCDHPIYDDGHRDHACASFKPSALKSVEEEHGVPSVYRDTAWCPTVAALDRFVLEAMDILMDDDVLERQGGGPGAHLSLDIFDAGRSEKRALLLKRKTFHELLKNLSQDKHIRDVENGKWDGLGSLRRHTDTSATICLLAIMSYFYELWDRSVATCVQCEKAGRRRKELTERDTHYMQRTVALLDKYVEALEGFDLSKGDSVENLGDIIGEVEKHLLREAINGHRLVANVRTDFERLITKMGAWEDGRKVKYCGTHTFFCLVFAELTNRGFSWKKALVELHENCLGDLRRHYKTEAQKHRITYSLIFGLLRMAFGLPGRVVKGKKSGFSNVVEWLSQSLSRSPRAAKKKMVGGGEGKEREWQGSMD